MGHVFVSYAHEDEEVVGVIASDLVSHGFDVWWDRRYSVDSQWVQAETEVGCSCKTLLPVPIADAPLRVPFQLLQTLDLSAGNGAFSAAQLRTATTAADTLVAPRSQA